MKDKSISGETLQTFGPNTVDINNPENLSLHAECDKLCTNSYSPRVKYWNKVDKPFDARASIGTVHGVFGKQIVELYGESVVHPDVLLCRILRGFFWRSFVLGYYWL